MSETRILIRLLRMYFPRNWEFGSALSKRRNFEGGGVDPPNPPRYATGCVWLQYKCSGEFNFYSDFSNMSYTDTKYEAKHYGLKTKINLRCQLFMCVTLKCRAHWHLPHVGTSCVLPYNIVLRAMASNVLGTRSTWREMKPLRATL
jgi:hypothetical protein